MIIDVAACLWPFYEECMAMNQTPGAVGALRALLIASQAYLRPLKNL